MFFPRGLVSVQHSLFNVLATNKHVASFVQTSDFHEHVRRHKTSNMTLLLYNVSGRKSVTQKECNTEMVGTTIFDIFAFLTPWLICTIVVRVSRHFFVCFHKVSRFHEAWRSNGVLLIMVTVWSSCTGKAIFHKHCHWFP